MALAGRRRRAAGGRPRRRRGAGLARLEHERLPQLARAGRRDPAGRHRPPGRSCPCSPSARATRAATSGWPRSATTSPRTRREPEVLVDALHHAREHLTTEQALALLRWLTDDYGSDARRHAPRRTAARSSSSSRSTRTGCATTSRVTRTGPGARTASATRRATRCTRTSTATTTTAGAAAAARRAAGAPSRTAGPSAFSAPETRALRDFVNSRVVDGVQQIRTHVTLHTNGELILWPYGYTKTNVPSDMTTLDHSVFVSLGRAMAARNGYVAEAVLRPVRHRRRPDRLDVRAAPHLHLHLRAVPARDGDGLGRPLPRRLDDRLPRPPATGPRCCS